MKIIFALMSLIALMPGNKEEVRVVVASETQNILIVGVENSLLALIEKRSGNAVVLKTDNGVVTKWKGHQFIIVPGRIGPTKISVCRVVNKDTVVVGTATFRAKRFPDPVATIGARTGGSFNKEELIVQGAVLARFLDGFFDIKVQVVEYTPIHLRDETVIDSRRNIGPRYEDKTKQILIGLQSRDKLIVANILALMPSGDTVKLQPLEFSIK